MVAHELLPQLFAVVDAAGRRVLVRVVFLRVRRVGVVVAPVVVVEVRMRDQDALAVGMVAHHLVGPGDHRVARSPLEREQYEVAAADREQVIAVVELARFVGAAERAERRELSYEKYSLSRVSRVEASPMGQ